MDSCHPRPVLIHPGPGSGLPEIGMSPESGRLCCPRGLELLMCVPSSPRQSQRMGLTARQEGVVQKNPHLLLSTVTFNWDMQRAANSGTWPLSRGCCSLREWIVVWPHNLIPAPPLPSEMGPEQTDALRHCCSPVCLIGLLSCGAQEAPY